MDTNPRCLHCDEPATTDKSIPHLTANGWTQKRWHWECFMRAIIGGLNHLRGTCTCCGGTEPPDPPEMTRREAALAALAYWKDKHGY
jgi:hypothetical protein